MLQVISGWQMSEVATWHKVPVVPDASEWPQVIAEALADGELGRRRIAENLRREHTGLIGDPNSHLMVGIWVPDRASGEIAAVMVLDLLVPGPELDPVTRDGYRSLVEPDRRRGIEVYERHLEEVNLRAGPALVAREVIARPAGRFSRRKDLQANVIYTVFPPGSCDAVQFTCSTELVELADSMAFDAAAAVATLHLELGEEQ